RAIESRVHACDIVEQLRDANPARQHGYIRNERDVLHEVIALGPWIASQHFQFSLIRSETKNCIERRGFACAIGTDEAENASFFNAQIDPVERNRCAEHLAQAACFYRRHGPTDPPFYLSCGLRHRAVLSVSNRAAELLRAPSANDPKGTSGVRRAT